MASCNAYEWTASYALSSGRCSSQMGDISLPRMRCNAQEETSQRWSDDGQAQWPLGSQGCRSHMAWSKENVTRGSHCNIVALFVLLPLFLLQIKGPCRNRSSRPTCLSWLAQLILVGLLVTGASAQSCAAGSYGAGGQAPCYPCPSGAYQPSGGQTDCVSCPQGYTTPPSAVNWTDVSACNIAICSSGYADLAAKRVTVQSSTSLSHLPSLAVDGDFTTFSSTDVDYEPWWLLDLGNGTNSFFSVSSVYLHQVPWGCNDPHGCTGEFLNLCQSCPPLLSIPGTF
jgi:hypothetical protein